MVDMTYSYMNESSIASLNKYETFNEEYKGAFQMRYDGKIMIITMMKTIAKLLMMTWQWKENGPYLFKLFKLSIAELVKCIGVTLLHLAKPHIANTVTHLAHIEESRAKGLWQKMLF